MGIDDIKRTAGPQTKNGLRWEVSLSAVPSREWLEFFKLVGESSVTASQRVVFDRDIAFFKSDAQHVEEWIRSIDKAIASANERYAGRLEAASRERATREDTESRERERIRELNERFKSL